jgi:tryptophan synthase alpha chain
MKKLFFPYLLSNFPDASGFADIVQMTAHYADRIEIGFPFSDPVADGPIIRQASEKVLAAGFQIDSVFRTLQAQKSLPAISLMTYANPVLAYGRPEFLKAAKQCGAKSLIVPDVPYEECSGWKEEANAAGLQWIQFVSLVTREHRLKQIAQAAEGFVYLLSLTGITGANIRAAEAVREKAKQIHQHTKVPVALGFGIKTAEDALRYSDVIDAFIVGSRIVELIEQRSDLESFYKDFRKALGEQA